MLTSSELRALDAVSVEECVQLTQDLVRIDSGDDDAQVATMLHDLLEREGLDCSVRPVPAGGANVVAQLGNDDGPRLLYNAHMDTVPVGDSTTWTQPPLAGVVSGGRLYGRGVSDCKGGLAAMAMACIALTRAHVPLPGAVTFTAVTGETKGNRGTLQLVDEGLTADFAVIGEYSEATKVAIAYRGVIWGRVTARGRTTHPGRVADGADAIETFLDHVVPALRSLSLAHEPHPLVPDAALTITRLDAGHAVNAVSDRCTATFDIRLVPGQRSTDIWQTVVDAVDDAARAAGTPIELDLIHSLDPFQTSARSPYVQALAECVSELSSSEVQMMGKVGMCDGNVLANRLAIPAVAYGPGNPSAAGVDEYCDIAALELSLKSYILFALRGLDRGGRS